MSKFSAKSENLYATVCDMVYFTVYVTVNVTVTLLNINFAESPWPGYDDEDWDVWVVFRGLSAQESRG